MKKGDNNPNSSAIETFIGALKATTSAVIWFILTIVGLALFSGCSSTKETTQPRIPMVTIGNSTDTKIIHAETIDTVFITPPAQSAERTTPEKKSHLETDYAESDARINEDGTLTHTLKNKTQPKPVPVKNSTDTIYVDRNVEVPVPIEVPVEVERELTWWQKTRLNTWGWLVTALALCVGWLSRKPLLTLARRLLTKTT